MGLYGKITHMISLIITIQTHKPYNNLLIASVCICTLCIVRYLIYLGISVKVAIMIVNAFMHL